MGSLSCRPYVETGAIGTLSRMSRGPGVLQRRIVEVLARERHRALDTREVAHLCGLFEDEYVTFGELEEAWRIAKGLPAPRVPLSPKYAAELMCSYRVTPPPSAMRNALRALTRLHDVHPNVYGSYRGHSARWRWVEAEDKIRLLEEP